MKKEFKIKTVQKLKQCRFKTVQKWTCYMFGFHDEIIVFIALKIIYTNLKDILFFWVFLFYRHLLI